MLLVVVVVWVMPGWVYGQLSTEADFKTIWKNALSETFINQLFDVNKINKSELPKFCPNLKNKTFITPPSIKSVLENWCQQRHLKPTYKVVYEGHMSKCKVKLSVVGINLNVEAEAANIKEAEVKCAWMIVDILLEHDLIHESLIPPKPFAFDLMEDDI